MKNSLSFFLFVILATKLSLLPLIAEEPILENPTLQKYIVEEVVVEQTTEEESTAKNAVIEQAVAEESAIKETTADKPATVTNPPKSEYGFTVDMEKQGPKPKTEYYKNFATPQNNSSTKPEALPEPSKNRKQPNANKEKTNWYDTSPIYDNYKNSIGVSLNYGFGKTTSDMKVTGTNITSRTYTKDVSQNYGFNITYLRAITKKLRLGAEGGYTFFNMQQSAENKFENYVIDSKYQSSNYYKLALEYDLYKGNSLSIFTHAGIGIALNSVEVSINDKSTGVQTGSEAVSFRISNKAINVGTTFTQGTPIEACRIEGRNLGYPTLNNITIVGNGFTTNPRIPQEVIFDSAGVTCNANSTYATGLGTTKKETKIATSIPFSFGLGANYKITHNIFWTNKISYVNTGTFNFATSLNSINVETEYSSSGYVDLSTALTFKF